MMADNILDAVADGLHSVLKGHYEQKRQEGRPIRGLYSPPIYIRQYEVTLRDAVFKVIEEAASKASAGFTLPFSVRQLYYQVRPLIQEYTDRELTYAYFTPPLVTEYEEDHGSLTGLIYEARGHLVEPHRHINLALGTVEVSNYDVPEWEYNKILFIEKEGFRQIFDAVKLGQRYDMALMTSQGFATRAAKELLERASGDNITILCAHDADISGYEIARTLGEETRTTQGMNIDVIDIGLSVRDALDMGLEGESVVIHKEPSYFLRLDEDERDFLLGERSGYRGYYHGKRVELNAMTTDRLISWLEGKLELHGLKNKVLPPEDFVKESLLLGIGLKLEKDAERILKEAIEGMLGETFEDIEKGILENIGTPDIDSCYEELKKFLEPLPPEPWIDWVVNKATGLVEAHVKDNETVISDYLSDLGSSE